MYHCRLSVRAAPCSQESAEHMKFDPDEIKVQEDQLLGEREELLGSAVWQLC